MKKNLFYGLLTVLSFMFATSCSNENLDEAQSGNEVQVSFQLGLEKGMGTRAISDGAGADKLVYAVFNDAGVKIKDTTITNVTYPVTESIVLPKGQTFKVAFWAQDADCTAYTVSDNMQVTVNYANATNNDETRDAFFYTKEFTVTGSTTLDIKLKRPFAQINVGVTEEDWNVANGRGVKIKESSVVIKNAATSLDLLTGKVSGSAEVTYSLASVPSETLSVDSDGNGTKESYKWLSMSYILPADASTGFAKTTLDGLGFVFYYGDNGENTIELNEGLNNVPVQRNWRTNILGNLLTSQISFNIAIDPAYDGDSFSASINGTSYSTLGDAIAAVQDGEAIKLEDETKLQATTEYMFLIDKPVTIDLNGKNIVANKTIFKVVEGGELTIKGKGNIQVENSIAETVIICNEGGIVNLQGGTLNGPGTIYNKKASETAVAGVINIQGSLFNNVDISDDFATKVTNNADLVAAINDPEVSTIILLASEEPYDITYSSKNSLTIIGTTGVKIQFTDGQVLASNYNQYTIHNCDVLPMKTKGWGNIVFGGDGKVNGIYTISKCTFNESLDKWGGYTQGIYINEKTSGVVYNVIGCTFNGRFGSEGAVTIQNNKLIEGGKVILNVFGCDFSYLDDESPRISYHYPINYRFLDVHTDLNEEEVINLNKTPSAGNY